MNEWMNEWKHELEKLISERSVDNMSSYYTRKAILI